MTYNAVPTVATGDLWTASNHNTYVRDNFAASVPDIFTAKGQIAVASAADAASPLNAGSDYKILMALAAETLGLKFAGLATDLIKVSTNASSISTSTSSTSYVDITNATVTQTLTATSTVILIANGNITSASGDDELIKCQIDGSDGGPEVLYRIAAGAIMTAFVIGLRTGVAAGSKTSKLQYKSWGGNTVNFYNGKMIVIAIPE